MATILDSRTTLTTVVLRIPASVDEVDLERVFTTAYGYKKVYRLGIRARSYPCQFMFTTLAQFNAFVSFFRVCHSGTNAFVLSRNGSGSDAVTVRFAEPVYHDESENDRIHTVTVTLEELPTTA